MQRLLNPQVPFPNAVLRGLERGYLGIVRGERGGKHQVGHTRVLADVPNRVGCASRNLEDVARSNGELAVGERDEERARQTDQHQVGTSVGAAAYFGTHPQQMETRLRSAAQVANDERQLL